MKVLAEYVVTKEVEVSDELTELVEWVEAHQDDWKRCPQVPEQFKHLYGTESLIVQEMERLATNEGYVVALCTPKAQLSFAEY